MPRGLHTAYPHRLRRARKSRLSGPFRAAVSRSGADSTYCGRVFDLHLPRRSLLTGLVLAPLTVAACSAKKHPAAAPSSGTTSSTSPNAPAATGKGLPADLLAV